MAGDMISVELTREDWERLLASEAMQSAQHSLLVRLREAIDTALTKRIEESVNRFMGVKDSE